MVLSTALADVAASAGGWDVLVGRAEHLGMDQLTGFDVLLVVSHGNGRYLQDAWKLESLDGMDTPVRLASSSDEFGRVSDGAGGQIPLTILPNSRLRAVLGRVIDPPPERCEAIGLLVLADTNRGPIVQSMSAFITDPFIGSSRFGPLTDAPVWPNIATVRSRAATTQTTHAVLAAGGLVSERNGLIDDRGDPAGVGTEFARNCDDVNSHPLLGPMPSFYVAEPELSQLSAVTLLLGSTGGGSYVTTPMDAATNQPPLLLAADATGDAAYYSATQCIRGAGTECRRLFLGDADLHYTIENLETQNVVLQQPPKHVDFLRSLGGMVDVSMREDYFAEFAQTSSAGGNVNRKLKTDWSLGVRVGVGVGPSVKPDEDFKSLAELSVDAEHRSVREQFDASQVDVSLTQTTGAVDDDVVWSKIQTTDFWRFPTQGGRPDGRADGPTLLPKDAYMEIAVPAAPITSIGPGSLSDAYQPGHQVGNILSYPTIAGDVQDIGELFNFLGAYVPMDEVGTRECKPASQSDPNGCIVLVNGFLQQVAQVIAGDEFVAGEFKSLTNPVDVAEVLQVGGISYAAELKFDTTSRRGASVTNSDTIKANLDLKLPIKGPKVTAEVSTQIRASASFENSTISENSLGTQTRIALHVPASIPAQRSYRVRPSFGFTPGGSLQVSYQVDTKGSAATFWEQHYGAPDPALNLPYRIVRGPGGFELNTDFSRNRMKGFFVRDGAGINPARPGASVGPLLVAAPFAGDAVQLEARVFNLSVASAVSGLTVEFAAQEYRNGQPVGPLVHLGDSIIDYLPQRGAFADAPNAHMASAFLIWDTTGFGPASGQALKDYLIYVTLDPANRISNETHELLDRFNDPLRGPLDTVVDATLEKGQNNRGWAMVRIAPSLALASSAGKTAAGARSGKSSSGTADPVRLNLLSSAKQATRRGNQQSA
ncbi:MAG: hypothetical protein HC872_03530 [Gammaproteobacteria bacterium]|nr:hypothetical protein [Gammaproteobacteria bacterium]